MRSDDILSLIDTALGDDSVSGDAMRSNPNTEAPKATEPADYFSVPDQRDVVCADGFAFSVLTGRGSYSDGDSVEVGYPSQRPEPWGQWSQLAEDPDGPTDTVYAYVPAVMVQALADHHGGATR
jgi:hypothetical protein